MCFEDHAEAAPGRHAQGKGQPDSVAAPLLFARAAHDHWQKLRCEDAGSTAVEFAIITPVLVTLLMGIVEFSTLLFTQATAGQATRDVARRVATNRLTVANAPAVLTPQLPAWVRSWSAVEVTQTTPGTPATNQITVKVSFPASKATPTGFLSATFGSLTLQSATTMQQEN